MADLILSASSATTWLDCHLQYWFKYVAMEDGISSWEREIGLAVHASVERALGKMNQIRHRDDTMGVVLDTERSRIVARSYGDLNDRMMALPRGIPHGKLGFEGARQEAQKALRAYWDLFGDQPAMLSEAAFEIDVDGMPYSGSADRVDATEDGIALRDLKVVGSRPQAGRYRFNMVGYWLGLRTQYDIDADMMVLDYIVRTKNPYHWPEWREAPDEDEIAWFSALLRSAYNGISEGDYRPTGLDHPWECRACEYRTICGPWQRTIGAE